MHSNAVPRRRHSAELKAKVLSACNEPGASIAAVALSHGLNANLVRKWLVGRGLKRTGIPAPVAVKTSVAAAPLLAADARFVPIELAVPAAARAAAVRQADIAAAVLEPIHIELRRGPLHLSVRWPSSTVEDCTAWLRELSSGLLK
ncbi:transposase [Roseateles sp.]|jgi:transposase|uniref:transposase n=1 Tax=Roseateles sp. TaxID=1971397 RepID=UPI003BA43654